MFNYDGCKLTLLPDKAQYRPGERVRIAVSLQRRPAGQTVGNTPADSESAMLSDMRFRWRLCELNRTLAEGEEELLQSALGSRAGVIDLPPFAESGAYGVFAWIAAEQGESKEVDAILTRTSASDPEYEEEHWIVRGETAFDVAASWREAPRYGFLSDFTPEDGDGGPAADFLLRHHLNVVQYYDWMYRHDCLLTDEDPFTDPLGRTVSLAAVQARIDVLRKRGIASLAYAAVYASLPDYAEAHPEQLLYRNDGTPYSLGGYFMIMDISPGSSWTEHVTDEFRSVVEWGFDGLHLDQYGFPKRAIRRLDGGESQTVRLAELYPALIERTREKLPDAGLIFNNVGTYPVHATANAGQDAVYIEVWDPVTRLQDLYTLVRRTRAQTRKPIILAAYLPPFHPEHSADPAAAETGAILAMATIFASGAYHLLLGENGGILADPYYPKYGRASGAFLETLGVYYDFIVMYRDILFDAGLDDWTDAFTGGINNELTFRAQAAEGDAGIAFSTEARAGTVWTLANDKEDAYIIHLLNLTDLDNDVWHAGKARPPQFVRDIEVTVEVVNEIEAIFAASPDGHSIAPISLPYEWVRKGEDAGLFVRFNVPQLDYWTVLCIRLRAGVPARTGEP